MILEKLDQALQKLDSISGISSTNQSADTTVPRTRDSIAELDNTPGLCLVDCLEVPTAFSSADCILSWPIFAGRWPQDYLSSEVFSSNDSSLSTDVVEFGQRSQRSRQGINEDDVPLLVERFLQLVHPKNPVLEARQIRAVARKVAEDGFSWDSASCVVVR